jgi:FkbM family methyltransferase
MLSDHNYMKNYSLKHGDTVLDLGACTGAYLADNLQAFKDTGSLYIGVEFDKWNLNVLKEYVKRHQIQNVIVEKAMWYFNGEIEVDISNQSMLHSVVGTFQFDPTSIVRREKVSCVSLDTLINTFGEIDFLKCDIEGSELSVFYGSHILSRVKNMCIAAYHVVNGEQTFSKLKPHLEALGFEVELYRPYTNIGETSTLLYCTRE